MRYTRGPRLAGLPWTAAWPSSNRATRSLTLPTRLTQRYSPLRPAGLRRRRVIRKQTALHMAGCYCKWTDNPTSVDNIIWHIPESSSGRSARTPRRPVTSSFISYSITDGIMYFVALSPAAVASSSRARHAAVNVALTKSRTVDGGVTSAS